MSNFLSTSEKELLLRVASGDELAFSELFNVHHQLLAKHIYKLTDSIEMAEEVVQDVFLKLWTNRQLLTEVENFRAYLFVLSKNHALNCLRQVARERVRQKRLEELALTYTLENTHQADEHYALLDQAIDRLPPQQQKVYLLSRHKRLKYDEIAAEMGLSRETVKKYIQGATHAITTFVQSNIDISAIIVLASLFFLKS